MSRRVVSTFYEIRLVRVSEDVVTHDERFKQPIGHTFYLACSSRNKRRVFSETMSGRGFHLKLVSKFRESKLKRNRADS